MLVSVIVPAYRQEKTIFEDIKNIYEVMSQTRWDFEFIVVVDGVIDNTYQNAKNFKKDNVKVLKLNTNHGKGYAVRYGMHHAKGDVIAFIDSGMEINPNGISMLIEHMEWYNADIIVGSKRHPASKVKMTLPRKIYSWGYHTLVHLLFNIKIHDTQTGIKVFKRDVLEDLLPRLLVKEFAMDIEMLAVAHYIGYRRIYEAPIEIKLDFSNGSKFVKGFALLFDKNIRKMLIDTLAVFYRLKILRYYDDANHAEWKKFILPPEDIDEVFNNNTG
jgi:glycosyltransferase involved in cell wall biosynthesis